MMWLPRSSIHLGNALDRKVVALGGAGGEDDFLRSRANQFGDLLARRLDRLLRFPTEGMIAAGRIAELRR